MQHGCVFVWNLMVYAVNVSCYLQQPSLETYVCISSSSSLLMCQKQRQNNTVLFMIFSYFVIFIAVFNFKWWTYQLIYCLYYIHTDVLKCGLLAKYLFFLCIILFTFFQLYYNITQCELSVVRSGRVFTFSCDITWPKWCM